MINNIVPNCKPNIPPSFFKVDSQAEGNSLKFFVLIYCCVYLGGVGG